MTAVPRLSIGLPVYNGEQYLSESLDALLGQTYEDFELIISDNASTDGTADICRRYAARDPRIRYVRQPRNIGIAPNHNFVFQQARGELFKWASHDDLYGRDLLRRCVEALDEHPHVVLSHAWTAMIDGAGHVTQEVTYPLATDSPHAPERFRSMLFADGGDDIYGVIRADVFGRIAPHDSYHHADRTLVAELALHGPFHQVPEWMYFRRDHPTRAERAHPTKRSRCVNLDPRRSDRLRHPTIRLLTEYVGGLIAAIRRAPLPPGQQRQCYRYLAQWLASRVLPRPAKRLAAPRVGLFGFLGSGNIGNDGSLEAVLNFLRVRYPEATLGCLCPGPDRVTARHGIPATRLHWYRSEYQTASSLPAIAAKTVGKGLDAFRTLLWVRRFDVVIVPGMGVLETTVPQRPWAMPYALFLLCASGRLCGTKIALVSVGANVIHQRLTRWLVTSAASLAHYRSYRDVPSRDAMRTMGVDTAADQIYPDLAFALPTPSDVPAAARTVGVGVMAYYGGKDDRRQADEIHASYLNTMKRFVRWLVDTDRQVRLFTGDDVDHSVVAEIISDVREHRPDLNPSRIVAQPASCLADLMHQMSSVDTVVATRYHNVLCALKLAKPTLSISYATKNDVLMAEMGLAEFCHSIRSLDVERLIEQFTALESRGEQLHRMLVDKNLTATRGAEHQFEVLSSTLFPGGEPAPALLTGWVQDGRGTTRRSG